MTRWILQHLNRSHRQRHTRITFSLLTGALFILIFGLIASGVSAASATKSNGTDGAADGGTLTRTVEFTGDDFSGNAAVSRVVATINFEKIDGVTASSCFSPGHGGGSPYNREIFAYLTSPNGTQVGLIEDVGGNAGTGGTYTYSSNDEYGGVVEVVFDDDAISQVGGTAPVGGAFRPEEPLSAFRGEDPLGTWTLTMGDTAADDPLCFYDFQLQVDADQGPTIDDQTLSVNEDSPNGTIVGTITASDPDAGDKLVYAVTGGTGTAVFDVHNTTAAVTVTDETQITTPGSFTLNVEVMDSAALTDTATITINVMAQNDAPIITEGESVDVTMDEDGVPTAFSLTLNASDEENDTLTWSIHSPAGHGTATAGGTGTSNPIGYMPDPNYHGSDSFVVNVDDGNGGSDTITVNVTVNAQNDNPTAADDTPTVQENSTDNTLDVLANDSGAPDSGETLTITAVGTPDNGGSVTNNGTDLTYTPAAGFSGTEIFTYDIDDGNGGSDTATVTVTVQNVNDNPVITESNPANVVMDEDGAPTAFSLTLNATDQDGDTLTWSIETQAGHGTASAGGTGPSKAIDYTPDPNYNGSDNFVVKVADGNGGSDTITVNVTINPQNDAPTANDDSYDVNENTSNHTLDVLVNDSDAPDSGETLTITAVGATDNGGTVTNNGINITYSPAPGFVGTETFTYDIDDGNGGSDTATVRINVLDVNEAPQIAEADPIGVTMDEDGTPTPFSLTLNASDGDGDTITWSIETQANHGTASASGTGPSKSIGYTPDANYNGSDEFTVKVSDGRGGSDTITVRVTINAQDDDPVAADDTFSVDEVSSNNTLDVLFNDSTPDSGKTLTITAVGPTDSGGTASNNTTDITYTPAPTFTGTEVFTYTIDDGTGRVATATVTVSVDDINFAPAITEGDSTSVTMDEDGAPTAFDLTLHASDPDGDTLTWSIQSQATHGTAAAGGTGTVKSIGYTPAPNYNGSDSFVVQVSDGLGSVDQIMVNVTIMPVNDDPTAVDDSATVQPDQVTSIDVLANDHDLDTGDVLSITAVTQGTHGSVSHDGSKVTYTPDNGYSGPDTFTYTTSDGNGGTDTATVSVTVGFYTVYLPLVSNNVVTAPDLVVTAVQGSADHFEIVIENQGNAATTTGFWVDLYIDPDPAPTHANQLWQDVADEGLVWGVTTSLAAGESLTLTYSTDPGAPNLFYSAANSSYAGMLPIGTPLYVQVDSAHLGTTHGGVLEGHEITGDPYNNVSTSTASTVTMTNPTTMNAVVPNNNPATLPNRK